MIVVAVETSTPRTSVAIASEREILGSVSLAGRRRQESVTPALEQLLAWTGVRLSQVGGIAAGIGPGLFTGLRVGVQTAKTLAQVLGVPIVGIASLDALAFAVRHTHKLIVAVLDGRRGEVFYAIYRSLPGGVVRGHDYAVATPDHLCAELETIPGDLLAVGDGAILYREQFAALGSRVEIASALRAHPEAAALAELAAPRLLREEHDRVHELKPLYLRRSDAEIAWERRDRRVGA